MKNQRKILFMVKDQEKLLDLAILPKLVPTPAVKFQVANPPHLKFAQLANIHNIAQ